MLTGRPAALVDRNGAPSGERHVLLVDPPLLEPASGARGLGGDARPALGAAVPPRRTPDDRLRPVAGRGRAAADRAARGAAREPRARGRGPRVPRRLPADGAAGDRTRAARRRDPRRRRDECARARRRHRAARRLDPRRLPGFGRRPRGSSSVGPAGGRARASRSSSPRARRSTSTSSTIPSSCSRARPRRRGSTRTTSTCCSPTSGRRPSSCRSSPARSSGPRRPTTCWRSSARKGHVRQAGDGRWYWSSENFPASEISLRTAAPENVVIIDTTPDRPRVLGEVDLFSAQVLVHERAIYIHEIRPVLRRPAGVARAQGVRPPDRRRPLHVRQSGGDAEAAGGLRGGAGDGRDARVHGEVMVASLVTLFKKLKFVTDENVGWGPIDLPELELQTTAYWLTADSARDRLAARRPRCRAARRRSRDPDGRVGAADGGPARPRPGDPGALAPRGGADDLPVRVGTRRDRALGTALAASRRTARRGGRPDRGVRVRRRLPGLHRSPARTGRRCEAPRAAVAGRARAPARGLARRDDRAGRRRRRRPLASGADSRASARRRPGRDAADPLPYRRERAAVELAGRLADAVDGEVVDGRAASFVRVEGRRSICRRPRATRGPAGPTAGRPPLLCLDTETTGLATAAGTLAFLDRARLVGGHRSGRSSCCCPTRARRALLDELAAHIPPDAWLVTYNGRGFDWPLLVTRYRMVRRAAPPIGGHLDLLPHVRRLFRHRLDDARLGTVERMLLGLTGYDDVDGWEIPAGISGSCAAARLSRWPPSCATTTRMCARSHACSHTSSSASAIPRSVRRRHVGTSPVWPAPSDASDGSRRRSTVSMLPSQWSRPPSRPRNPPRQRWPRRGSPEEPWWSPRRRADFGGRPETRRVTTGWDRREAFSRPWDEGRIAVDRAHLLRRLGRVDEAIEAWDALACGPGRTAVVAAIEAAKLREHRSGDPAGAMAAVERGLHLADRRRARGMPEPALEADLRHRWRRLRDRLARTAA